MSGPAVQQLGAAVLLQGAALLDARRFVTLGIRAASRDGIPAPPRVALLLRALTDSAALTDHGHADGPALPTGAASDATDTITTAEVPPCWDSAPARPDAWPAPSKPDSFAPVSTSTTAPPSTPTSQTTTHKRPPMTAPLTITIRLAIGSLGTTPVQIDPYAANPIVDELKAKNPATYAAALADGPPPTLFASGDLPPFVAASGVDVQTLMRLPFGVRHFAATATTAGEVLHLIETCAGDPDATADSPGLADYLRRVADWISGRNTNRSPFAPRTEAQHAGEDSTYNQMFAELDKMQTAKYAAANQVAADATAMRTRTGAYADGLGRAQR